MRIRRIRIGSWVLDPADGTLTSEHTTVRLEPKVLAVLVYLVERGGAVVPHEDLLRDVWKDTHVVPGALARTISLVRTALGDDAYRPAYVETIPKRGYRFIADVEELAPVRTSAPAVRLVAAVATITLLIIFGGQPRYASNDYGMFRFAHETREGNETAFEHYSREVKENPRSAEGHAGLATVFLFRANYLPEHERWNAAAVESANRALALDARSAMAARTAGMAYTNAGRYGEAERHYRRALELNPDDHATPLNLGRLLILKGRAEAAVELIRNRVTVMPDTTGYAYLAAALWQAGRLNEAATAARTAAQFQPFATEPQLLLSRHELVGGDYDGAGARLRRLLQAHPDCTQCVVQLGIIEQQAGSLAGAETRYREALAMTPSFVAASMRLAHVLSLTKRHGEGSALLQPVEQSAKALIDAGSELWQPRWNLAVAAAIRGDRESALSWFREAVRMGRRDAAWDAFEPMFDAVRPLALDGLR